MEVDLEDLATGYDHRPASAPALARARRAAAASGLGAGDTAVDIGGGPGEHAAEWARTQAQALVVDASPRMATAASRRVGVAAINGTAQALPLRSGCASLCYFHLSIHYGDWQLALDEATRVLRPGGQCWIWTMGEKHHRSSFLARWFPSVGDIDAGRFPDPSAVAAHMVDRGATVQQGQEREYKTKPAGVWRAAVEARFVSTLQLVPAAEFTAGLAEFNRTHPDPAQPIDYLLTFDWIQAIM